MEVVLLASGLNTLLPRLWDKRNEAKKTRIAIDINIEAIRSLSNRLDAALEDAKFKDECTAGAVVTELKRRARELSQNTRDCIQRFFKNKEASSRDFETKTREYRDQIEDICKRLENHTSSEETASEKPGDRYVADPMGMEEHLAELMQLVKLPGSRPSEGRRKVISIVGFGGLGKTILANMVYERTGLVHRARVTAAAKDADEVLSEILKELPRPAGQDENLNLEKLNLEKLAQLLAKRLRGKRYLIVIDDMQRVKQWSDMNDAFPKHGEGEGTIIVTTTIHSVANVCSSCNSYVYKLSPLDEDKSLDLFLKERMWNPCSTKMNASDILKKCDGLPLAIVAMSQFLQGQGGPTSSACENAFKQGGASLVKAGDGDLERLRWVLMKKYTGLTGDPLRSCLLYFCMYKRDMDAVPRKNSMIRRWDAEGFLVAKDPSRRPSNVAAENLKTLVDRNIIQPMEVGTDGSIRRCRPPGMMLEYISQISKSENFTALVSDVEEPKSNGVRRLSFRAGSAADDRKMSDMNLSIVLTLAVSGNGCPAILDFQKYELIAVLDLKECTNLEHRHVIDICKLVLLKYLSLGDTIGEIPTDIGELKLLDTLEVRTAKTVVVCSEALELPNLKHFIGNFMLGWKPGLSLRNFLEKKSRLETITGFVTKTAKGFPKLMCHMRRLRKVKIYCTRDASDSDLKGLQTEIKAFTAEGLNMVDRRSLSIDFAEFPDREGLPSPLEFLQDKGSIGSLKLVGDWRPLLRSKSPANPHFIKICGITKLCLSHTCLRGNDVLACLTDLIALEYLKLDEQELGPLAIKSGSFQKLRRLCLVGEINRIMIQLKALPSLESLHLISKDLHGGLESSIGFGCVESLKEIALHSEVRDDIKDDWKEAAKAHPNRPGVLLIQKDGRILHNA